MRKIALALFILLATLPSFAGNFRLEAHRGICNRFPENTVLSFEQAIKVPHYAGMETDVQMTKDGVLVIMHDKTLDRTTNGTGKACDYTYDELLKLEIDGGVGWNAKYAGQCRIPTFQQYLDVMKKRPRFIPYVELKELNEEGVRKTVEMLDANGFKGKYVMTSFNLESLVQAKKYTDAPLEYMKGVITTQFVQDCVDNGFIIRPKAASLTAELVADFHSRGLRVEAFGLPVGDLALLECLEAWGVEGVTCNDWKGLVNDWTYTDATTLTVPNKLLETENPWSRLDVGKYKGMTKGEQVQGRRCTGLAVCFETDSRIIGFRTAFAEVSALGNHNNALNTRGFDLYIKKDGKWLWAESKPCLDVLGVKISYIFGKDFVKGPKQCLLYLPSHSQITSLEIITEKGSRIVPADPGFKGRIAVFGSSYMNNSGGSRSGMSVSAQLARRTGYNFINMGFAGNSKLQQYFATALIEAEDVDAYVFDAFSNPGAKMIEERLFPFIERFQKEKPGVPLIFMKSAYRENRNFRVGKNEDEAAKMAVADSLMRIAVRKYKDVYWLDGTRTYDKEHEWTTDGIHPDDYGYYLWAESVREPICRILKKYIKK